MLLGVIRKGKDYCNGNLYAKAPRELIAHGVNRPGASPHIPALGLRRLTLSIADSSECRPSIATILAGRARN